ncbi:hypothetical protein COOONC_18401 [Cooperia oncophora]
MNLRQLRIDQKNVFEYAVKTNDSIEAIHLTPARKLLNDLLPDTYETAVRPGSNDTPTIVTIIPNKLILLAMDQQQEWIRFSEELLLTWIDPKLSWNRNTTEYSREWIKIAETSVWVPDIIYTSAFVLLSFYEKYLIMLKYGPHFYTKA